MTKYDMNAARSRIQHLTALYRQLAKTQEKDGSWDWWIPAEIEGLEQEIAEAHQSVNGKIAAGQGDYQVIHIENIISPIVPQWCGINQ